MRGKLAVITLLLVTLIVLTSCSLTNPTGGVVADDACSALEGAEKDNFYS